MLANPTSPASTRRIHAQAQSWAMRRPCLLQTRPTFPLLAETAPLRDRGLHHRACPITHALLRRTSPTNLPISMAAPDQAHRPRDTAAVHGVLCLPRLCSPTQRATHKPLLKMRLSTSR